ncbi:hypothetical protein [Corynebacterium sp.]|uniref:hypothetical protein n=1 Tax=Corynebacterium sp. TaxID=1720 RepID=UPI0025BFDFC0|nr:hypothetical protein [Corynebacterium sp.]
MKPESELHEVQEPADTVEEHPGQPEIPGSSTADVVTLLFMAVMIIATVGCFIFIM